MIKDLYASLKVVFFLLFFNLLHTDYDNHSHKYTSTTTAPASPKETTTVTQKEKNMI